MLRARPANDADDWPHVLTVDELAALLRVDEKTVYAAIGRGEISGVQRIGRVLRASRNAVLAWLRDPFAIWRNHQGGVPPNEKELLAAMDTEQDRIAFLEKRGYTSEVARILSASASDAALRDPTFYVKRVTHTIDTQAPSYETEIQVCNRIDVRGDASTQ